MDLETTQTNAAAKLPLVRQGEYELWRLRIEQYFQIQDYALWEVIENGNSFKPVPRTTQNADGTSTSMIPGAVTTEEKTQKKNDVKARSMLLMALPNEHLLTFNQYKDSKTLFDAIQTRFGGNDATKKTQKTLLKQMYENFNSPSTESLDSIFNRLQKIFLRSLPSEWNTHVVVWRNKPDLDTMSFDDLYNNFKIVEQEVKRTATSSTSSSSHNMAFVSSPSITNEVNTANVQVSTANSSVSTDSTQDSTTNLSDATVYAFLANQPNGSQLVHEDLEQIHEDDLEEMDLKWQLALLSMRARRYYQRTGKKITFNGSDIVGYDKSKVECFNCHKMGHFTRECRSPRNQESMPRNHNNGNMNQDRSRRTVNVEETSSKAMVAIDGAVEFNKSEFNLATYNRGLAYIEEQLVFYKKNEVMFYDQIVVLKRDASFKDSEIIALKSEIEKLKKEKECNQIKINKFENASKFLEKLIGSIISDNSRKIMGYNVVPPPPTGLFAPPTIDLSNSGLEEFQQPEFKGYGPKVSKSVCVDTSIKVKKTPDTSLVKELVSEKEKQTVFPTKIEFVKQHDKTARKPVKYAEMYRSQKPRGNQRNWNNLKSQQLGSDFVMYNKACFVCGSFDHVQAHCKYHQRERMVYVNNYNMVNYNYTTNRTHPNAQRNMVPRAVLMKTSLKPFNTARTQLILLFPNLQFLVLNQCYVFQNQKALQSETVLTNKNFSQKVNTSKAQAVNTARPKAVNTARPNSTVANTVRANQANAVKASACWVWRPIKLDRHMTGNISYLLDFHKFDGGYVTLPGGGVGGKKSHCGKNRVILVKPHNKTPYELFRDHLGKFDGKSDDGFFIEYSLTSKDLRVYNIRTMRVEENLHIRFLEDKPIVSGDGPKCLFDLDSLTKSMNYVPFIAGTNSNDIAGSEVSIGGVHVCQPPWFEDPDYPDKVYKVVKALYGLHQAPRAWYETLAKYLLDNGFHRGKIDQTLFIKKQKGDILLVQVYVDDIIFGSTKKELCLEFEKLMHDKFQMSSIGELTFFLGLQVKKKEDRIFISQDKYVTDILKKFSFQDVRTASHPWIQKIPCSRIQMCKKQTVVATSFTEAEYVADDILLWTKYSDSDRTMVKVGDEAVHKELGDRMERAATTASSLEAKQDSDAQTRFEAASKQSNDPPLSRVNTLRSREDSMKIIELMAHCTTLSELKSEGSDDFHRIIDFLTISHIKYALTEKPIIYVSLIHQFWETASASTPENGEMEITATIDGKVKTVNEASIRRHLKLEDADGISSLPNTEIFKQLALMGHKKTAWEQFSSNIATAIICLATNRTFNFSKMIFEGSTVLVESHPTPTSAPSTTEPPTTPPSMQTTHDAEEPVTMPHDSSHPRVQSLGSDEGSLTLNKLMVLYTTLSKKVEDLKSNLKQIKLNYGAAYTKLIIRVKKLEHKVKSSQPRRRARVVISNTKEDLEDPSKQGRKIAKIDQNPSISLVQDEGTSWIQEDAEIQERTSADTEILLDQKEPTKLVEDFSSGEKCWINLLNRS
ncbi:putative ribonuclease H-like domain-containing protein [Tanacetum coccineum]